ncbi:MAG TPA: putative 2OG-Fe(II) oxygenase [Vitreimonas sp.]|uniref:putative 2OG-Fe(II) oxygenase n=1 Tax=Vitreimonas sp. TaxID=3069702 RepID=UPI002D2730B7|nr:putative 2OG-Fe(II) oxygenase [Vitreimonas sp.]HYD88354.1 putative 2OG-Fe(II) oxygenase [Vitreimonas sp.]
MTPDAVLREAERLLKSGDALAAERALATLWADTANAPAAALHLLGLIRRGQNRIPESERYFRRAIAREPGAPQHHFALAELLAGVGAHAHAMASYHEVLRLDPAHTKAPAGYARSAFAAGALAEAEAAARALAERQPHADHWELLSRILRSQDKLEDALAAADAALKADAAHIAAAHARASILARLGRNDEAIAALEALSGRGVQAPALAFVRGTALFNLARSDEAEAAFAAGVQRWPQDPSLQNALANARWMRGEAAAFTRDFEAAVARQPDNTQLRIMCADLLRRAEFAGRSEALLREGLARQGDHVGLLASLGVLLDESDRTAEGLPLLQRAAKLAPHLSAVRANLTCALLRLGRGDEALAEIEPARRSEPLNQEWICYETMALRQLGHPRYRELCDYELMVRPYDLAPPRGFADMSAFNQALAASLAKLHVLEAHPLDQSLRGGSQTSRSLLYVDDPIIQAYLTALAEPIHAYMAAMGPPDPNHPWSGRNTGKFRLSGAWSVKLKANGFHINHVHPAGWISSAYYVSLPPVVEQGDGQQGWIKFGEPRWPTPGCTVEKVVQPREGRLVLFPSYMWHGTIPFSAGERLTAPFDAVPV